MTNFKRYLRSHLKANLKPIIFILSIVLILTFIIGFVAQPRFRYGEVYDFYSTLYAPVIFLCVLAYLLPIMEFSFFKKRINLDCAYSLPISRRTMGTVHYLTGLIILFGTFTASYLLNFIMLFSRGPWWFDFPPMIPHYFLCLLIGFSIYSMTVFVFNEANTITDGVFFSTLYVFVFYLAALALTEFFAIKTPDDVDIYMFIQWGTIDEITTKYQYIVEKDTLPSFLDDYTIGVIFWSIIGIASAIGAFFTFGKRKMEKTEEISDSWFGYRTLIPIYAISGNIILSRSTIFWITIEILALLLYTVYRRGFHYKKSDIIILICIFLFA